MKRTIVTGASGFIGANLASRLVREGNETHVFARPGSDPWRLQAVQQDVRFHHVALEDADALRQEVTRVRPDWVFHLAAHGGYSWQTDTHGIVQSNLEGTINMLGACVAVGFEAFVNTGSSSEYGFTDHAPSEEEPAEPNSTYAVTKAAATLFCRHVARSRNVQIATLRLYSVYGPFEESRRLVPTLILRGFGGELPPLVSPDTARDFVYIDDVIDAYLLAASQPAPERGAIYNVGTGVQTTVREAVAVARQVLDIRAEPRWQSMPDRGWDTTVWVADNQKIRSKLAWSPRYSFEQGFRRTVDWFHANPQWQQLYRKQD